MSRFTPWAGWAGGVAGWLAAGQSDSMITQAGCARAYPGLMLAIAIGGAVIVLAGALVSFNVWRAERAPLDQPRSGTRRFIAGTGALAGSLFLLALVFQTASSFILPQCHA